MRIFTSKAFARFAKREGIPDSALWRAIGEVERGLIDADLGGGVIKKRIARAGQGKSGGFRTMLVYRQGERAFFVHGFAKRDRANIGTDELVALRVLAGQLLAYDNAAIAKALSVAALIEVKRDENDEEGTA
mgnify:CR=1 FL=1